ncbi:winged-helix domain-containing protein [Pullulanibacillus sp. KACC 23026]|uniref:winged-helix domain-containing protein n=1 Tax=Pullulanibacillus sp. KACC 23026 TaxID=3028315 RepID=UPI0023AED07C|nr:winged-helix domain-containing protein [Pullulanibacillus sp. KACC 23026]WEG12594.1 winged-helix domain-containing protein [Pullulanibacillus sp. KACC 23026]
MKNRKHLLVIAIQEKYLKILSVQIKDLFRDRISVSSVTVKELNHDSYKMADAILLSGTFIYQLVKGFLPKDIPVIFAKRAVNTFNIKELMELPKGQTILVVNDQKQNTDETVENLNKIVFEHHFIPYYPDYPIDKEIDYIVTPGERDLVPSFFKKVIDVGTRVLDLGTVFSIINTLGLSYDSHEDVMFLYMRSLVYLSNEGGLSTHFPVQGGEILENAILEDKDNSHMIYVIEQHGFLEESLHILKILLQGKENFSSYGRKSLEKMLYESSTIELTEQQLRQRLKVLQELGLVNVRQGRAGTTISKLGETFLKNNSISFPG